MAYNQNSTISPDKARQGEVVTTIDKFGGLGIGYLVDDQVWTTTGTAYAIRAEDDVFGMTEYKRDGGNAYMTRVKSFGL